MELTWLLVGAGLGAVVTAMIFFARGRSKVSQSDFAALKESFDSLRLEKAGVDAVAGLNEERLRETETHLEQELRKAEENAARIAASDNELRNLRDRLDKREKELEELHKRLTSEFENIASRIINNSSQLVNERQAKSLDQILNPLKEKIEKFENKVDQTHKENIRDNQSLKEQLQNLQTLNASIGLEAKNLTSALKGQTKVQGNWGEYILESILEKSGLVKGREYHIQVSMTSEEGRRMQPDVVINLPEGKNLVVDSKVSLIAYERYCNAETDDERGLAFLEHLGSVKKHIKDLGSKNYQQLYQLQSLDFVVMFIPVEPAFYAAVQADFNLFNEAYERNIVLVCPSTLLATVRTVASIWRQEYQNRNAIEIARQSGDLYDKFVGFLSDMSDIGDKLKKSQISYENAMKKLAEGRGNLISKAEKIKEMGARTSKAIPADLIDKVNDNNYTGLDA